MESKKYYWLRLHKDFFKRHDIQIVESMPNGKDYILFYLKLLVESVSHEGNLRFSELIPYNAQMLSTITNTNVDVVDKALKVFQSLGMIAILDDETIYMTEVDKMIGSTAGDEHSNASARERMRAYRARKKEAQNLIECKEEPLQLRNSYVTRYGEIEKEIEIEKENIYIPGETPVAHEKHTEDIKVIISHLNEVCGTHYQANSEKTKRLINARFNDGFTLEDFKAVIEKKHASWKGTEWEKFLRPETLFGTKFEGYLNEKDFKPKSGTKFNDFENKQAYDMDALERELLSN